MRKTWIAGGFVALLAFGAHGEVAAAPDFDDFVRPDMPNGAWSISVNTSTQHPTNSSSAGFYGRYKAAFDEPGRRGLGFAGLYVSGHRGTSANGTGYGYDAQMKMFHPDKYGAKGVQSKASQKSHIALSIGSANLSRTVGGTATFSSSASFSGVVEQCSGRFKAKGIDEVTFGNTNSVKLNFKCKGPVNSVLGLTTDQAATLMGAMNLTRPNIGPVEDMRSFGKFFDLVGAVPYVPYAFP